MFRSLVSSIRTLTLVAAAPTLSALAQTTETVTLVHYNDLHAHLVPHLGLDQNIQGNGRLLVMRGGLAKVKTVFDQVRAGNPGNTLVMNIGDTFHGGVEALYTEGNAIMAPVNLMGFDVGVMGNWDWAYGPLVTRYRFGNLNNVAYPRPAFPYIGGNVTYATPPFLAGQPIKPATLTRTLANGVKVGFIGIQSDIVPMMDSLLAVGFSFMQGEANFVNYVNTNATSLRSQGCQVVVVMSELGIHKDNRLANLVTPLVPGSAGVDVFFSAHTHELTRTPLTSASGAAVVEAGDDGWVGRMDLTVTNGAVTNRVWSVIPVTPNTPDDPTVASLVAQARAPFLVADPNLTVPNVGAPSLHQSITTVVGVTHALMDRRAALESSFNNYFTDALREKAGTRVAMSPGFRFESVLSPPAAELNIESEPGLATVLNGQVTLEDVYRYFPVPYTLATGQSTGAHLRSIMETTLSRVFSTTIFNQAGGWFDGFSGVDMILDLAGSDGSRIGVLKDYATGLPYGDAEAISVAGCQRPTDAAGTLCSYTGFTSTQALVNPATGQAWTPVDVFIDGLNNSTTASATRRNLTDTNSTPIWPCSDFVQPLNGAALHGGPPSCPEVGFNFCISTPNSSGGAALMSATGSNSISANDLTLRALPVPPNVPGIFFFGTNATQVTFGNGMRCVAGTLTRLPIGIATPSGELHGAVNNAIPPAAPHLVAGSTWNFQAYFRDAAAGGSNFNLSDGYRITFHP